MKSSQFSLNFTVSQLESRYVDILSVFNNKLLVGSEGYSQLFIYSHEGRYLSTITINDNDQLSTSNIDSVCDATWTPHGSIVYTTKNNKLVVISASGEVSTPQTQIKCPQKLHVSSDGIIYLTDTDWTIGLNVYQSTDDGVSWSLVFKIAGRMQFYKELFKVATDHVDEFWILKRRIDSPVFREQINSFVYCMNKRRSDGTFTRRNIKVDEYVNLFYDGNMNIFLSDWSNEVVYVLSANGQYHCQLLSSRQIKNFPCKLVVDKERQLLYIGESKGVVEVFELTYGDGG